VVDASELRGATFFDLSRWPRLIRQGDDAGTRALQA
jgi:hypothetical protein